MVVRVELYYSKVVCDMGKKNKKILMLLILMMLLVGIGYASLKLQLTITGTTTIKNNNFSIKFANIVEKEGSVTPTKAATIGSDNISVSFDVILSNPGEFYGFNLDIVNDGSLSAVIESFNKTVLTEEQQKYLSYEINYVDGTAINIGDFLGENETNTISVLISYKENPEEMPSTSEQTLNFSFSINFVEGVEPSEVVRTTLNSHAQALPDDLTSTTNLYTALTPKNGYYTATGYDDSTSTGLKAVSIVIPVVPGDKVQSSSFNDTTPPTGGQAGIRVTYLMDNTIVSSFSPTEVNAEYISNNYLTVPEGVNAMSIVWWEADDTNWAYLLVP